MNITDKYFMETTVIAEGTLFTWGSGQRGVVVKILNQEVGLFYCVYHQNRFRYAVVKFTYCNGHWAMSDEPSRQIRENEWHEHVIKLKQI